MFSRRISRLLSRTACVFVATCAAGSAIAHHSFAMFDREREVKLVGTVHEFQWTNPHAWIEVDVQNDKGGSDRWGVELNSPNNLTRQGWRSSTLKAGDHVTVTINPLRSGEKGGLFVSVVLPNGKLIGSPSGPPPTAKPQEGGAK